MIGPRTPCDLCDEDVEARWVIDCDLGDANDGSGVCVVIRLACDECKATSSYMEPEPLDAEWRRRLRK